MDPRFPAKRKGRNVHDSMPLPEPLPEPIFTGQSAGAGFATKAERDLQRPPTKRSNRNEGVLGHITSNLIDQEAMLAMDTSGYLEPLKVLKDVGRFRANFIGPLPMIKKPSRFMLQHVGQLEAQETMRRTRRELYDALPVFTTPKKSEELRLVQDCTALNKAYARPPSMDIPLIHDLIDDVLAHSVMGQVDGVSYFYQYGYADDVARYFGARLCGARGDYVDMEMMRMAMGWSWAPCIGQRCANVLVRGLGRAWVDNFILLGKGPEDYASKKNEFFSRAAKVNLELDASEKEVAPKTRDVALGIDFDLQKKRYRMDPAWILKASARIEDILAAPMTIQDLYVVAGTVVWRHHVMRYQLCNVPHLLAEVGRVAKQIAGGARWEDAANVKPECMAEIRRAVALMVENPWKGPRTTSEPECEIFSDASSTHWAFLVFRDGKLAASGQGPTKAELHIFYSELSVALGGLSAAARIGCTSALSNIDNAAAAGALARGASSNYTANRWIAGRLIEDVRVRWVSTTEMLADPYTRVPLGQTKPVPLPPVGTTLEEALVLLRENQRQQAREKASLRRPWEPHSSFSRDGKGNSHTIVLA